MNDPVAHAAVLRSGADGVLADLAIADLVAPYGELVPIGSYAAGLMAVRDIDLAVRCPAFDQAGVTAFTVAQRLFAHPCVRRVQVHDERPPFQSMPGPENEGGYCGICYDESQRRDREWTIDLWYFPADAPRPEIPLRDRLLAASADERGTILRLKHALLAAGRYGNAVHGIDVYRAVLDRGDLSLEAVMQGMLERADGGGS